jgi:hypothetical protein
VVGATLVFLSPGICVSGFKQHRVQVESTCPHADVKVFIIKVPVLHGQQDTRITRSGSATTYMGYISALLFVAEYNYANYLTSLCHSCLICEVEKGELVIGFLGKLKEF